MTVKLKWVYSPAAGWNQASYSLMMGSVKVASAFYDPSGPRGSDENKYRINMLVPGIQAREPKWPTLVDAISIGQRVMIRWLKQAELVKDDKDVEFDHSDLHAHVKQPEQKDV